MPAIRERLWDCPSCGSVGVRGRYKSCPNCGTSRGATPTYLPDNAPVVTDASLLDLAHAGADWNCEHCGESNRGDHNFCTDCGAPKGSSPSNAVKEEYFGGQKPSNVRIEPSSVKPRLIDEQTYNPPPTFYPPPPPSDYVSNFADESPQDSAIRRDEPFPWGGVVKLLALLLLIAAIAFGIYKAFEQHEIPVTADQFTWSRNISVQEYQTYREGDWSVPPSGRYVSQEQRVHHYNQVPDGETCRQESYTCGSRTYTCGSRDLGNGFSEDIECSEAITCEREVCQTKYRDDPVYATWYTYDIDRWGFGRNVSTSGTNRSDPPPFWGELILNCANQAVIGCERENGRQETYTVIFIDSEGKTYSLNESADDWLLYEPNGAYTVFVNSFGIQNDPLRPEDNE